MKKLHAIVPAGGAGTRLWPISRQGHPKFLLDVTKSGWSLLQETVLRLGRVSQSVTVVTGLRHLSAVQNQLQRVLESGRLPKGLLVAVIAEPSPRDSMPAIALATYLLGKKYGSDALIGSFAADHVIPEAHIFHDAVHRAIGAAEEGYLTTIGLEPTAPSTAYGYIHATDTEVAPGAFLVQNFEEKPSEKVAEAFIEDGYLWNAGMFIFQAKTVTDALAELHPQMHDALNQVVTAWRFLEQQEVLTRNWPRLERISIDHALAEPLAQRGLVATTVMKGSKWTDLGDFASLAETERPPDQAKQHVVIDSPGSVVQVPPEKAAVVVGIPGVVVIDTPDALLVTTKEHAQRVKEGVDALEDFGFPQYL